MSDEHRMDEGKLSGEGMRIGYEYQAEVPDYLEPDENTHNDYVEPLQVWAPNPDLLDSEVDVFLKNAKEKHCYNMEQALGMLYWHSYNVEKATDDLKHFTPLPDEWSMEDRVIFDQSFHSYGKHFSRIKQQLSDKSIGSLVKYYYTWKKSRNKSSLMDKEAKRINIKNIGSINSIFTDEDEGMESEDSDFEDQKASSEFKPSPMLSTNCVNCAGVTSQMHPTPRGKMCSPCFEYWKHTGILCPKESKDPDDTSLTALYRGHQHKLKKKPPKGMTLNEEALLEIAQSKHDNHVQPFDVELIALKRQVSTTKDIVGTQKEVVKNRIDQFRPPELIQKQNPRWTNEELLIAVQCVRKYGKDFNTMAEVLGNKNANQCHNFFINYRRRFNLMEVLYEYEKEHNIPRSEPHSLEVCDDNSGTQSPSPSTTSTSSSKDGNGQEINGPKVSTSSQPPPLYREASDTSRPNMANTESSTTSGLVTASSGPPPLMNNSCVSSNF